MSAELRYKAESSDEHSFEEETEDVNLPDIETEEPETAHETEPVIDEITEALKRIQIERRSKHARSKSSSQDRKV